MVKQSSATYYSIWRWTKLLLELTSALELVSEVKSHQKAAL